MSAIVEVECPHCHAKLWVDAERQAVVQHKRSEKKVHSSFEELLQKEKAKKEKVDERFVQAKELKEAKKQKAEEIFKRSLQEPNEE